MKKFAIIVALAIVGTLVFAETAATTAKAAPGAKAAVTSTAKPAARSASKVAVKTTVKPAVKAETASVSKPVALSGTVSGVIAADAVNKTPVQLIVLGADGKSLKVTVKASAAITGADGKVFALDKIAANAKVQLDYVVNGTEADAVSIRVM